MSKEDFKKVIEDLVAKFDRNIEKYKDQSSSFNETQLRIEFIDPMFEALGWDMNNKAGAAEQYKEVIHEDKVYIEGKPKAPDYSFKFWGERKFFLEAKQPFVKIKSDYKPALQLRRYAWSAHLPISILSDFEELAIYDTTIEPKPTDKASTARLTYYKYTDYLGKWEEIYDLFAKESIQQGSFDKFIAKEKKGSQLVDKVFLKEIEDWREWLAKDLAKLNKDLDVQQLNFAVQKIIDRITFLRIAEDRGIEQYKTLERIISSKSSYPELVRYFSRAQDKYNSGLFDFEADTITPNLEVSDKLLDKILEHLYYPNSPYEFSVLGVEVLGSIYEQFLGKVIRLTDSHNAKVEEKPEVKKAGGVYYTPQYVVEYIVKNTVGELIKDKSVKQVEKIKVLDPACGSGSFLIGAYDFLLNWHLDQYIAQSDTEKEKLQKKGVIYKQVNKESSGQTVETWQLTTNEKKRIMLNNIYGVDIDAQAVEVTKLSLALKMLENENHESLDRQLKLFADRVLPDMSSNIKSGNSLINSSYWNDKNLGDVDEDELLKVNTFDWHKQFKEVFTRDGFDAVIGNPPYGAFIDEGMEKYLVDNYKSTEYQQNTFSAFIEKGLSITKTNGYVSYIVPAVMLAQHYFSNLREIVLDNSEIEELVILNYKVFDSADTGDTLIFNLRKTKRPSKDYKFRQKVISTPFEIADEGLKTNIQEVLKNERKQILLSDSKLFEKISEDTILLGEIAEIITGIKPYQSKKGKPKQTKETVKNRVFDATEKKDETYVKYLVGKDIDKYKISPKEDKYISYGDWLAEPRKTAPFEREKVVMRQTSDKIRATLDTQNYYVLNNIYTLESINAEYPNKYLLGVLNSKLFKYVYQYLVPEKNRVFAELKKVNLAKLPIKSSEHTDPKYKQVIINCVQQLLEINDEESKSKQTEMLQDRIDEAVNKIYGLSQEQINIIDSED